MEMTLDLKQTVFIEMAIIINTARNHLDEKFKAFDLSRPAWLALGLLRSMPDGVSQSYVKSYLSVETSYLSKILNVLENRNLIVREIDKNDRRNRIIKASNEQPEEINKIFQVIDDLNESIGIDLTQSDLKHMHACLDKIKNKLSEH
jgi:DNA-binding MarR family transcriptional regulator